MMTQSNIVLLLMQVIFSSNKKGSYHKFNLNELTFNTKYGIYFETTAIQDAFEKLLRYECQECIKADRKRAAKSSSTSDKTGRWSPAQSSAIVQDSAINRSNKPLVRVKRSDGEAESDQPSDSRQGSPNGLSGKMDDECQGLLTVEQISKHTFDDEYGLKVHLNIVHKLKLCDLCLKHNKLFPYEFSYYTSKSLHDHVTKGEPNTSHRGHPNCKLCHDTFFNNDDLLLHMSREHYHCHLCGRHNSNMHIYFLDYESLRQHFKKQHYVCEKGNCRDEQFTSAFESEVDLHIHQVEIHGASSTGLSRGGSRLQRTIQLQSAPHRNRPNSPMRQNLPPNTAIVSHGPVATANDPRRPRPESIQAQIIQQRLPSRAEFPALGQNSIHDGVVVMSNPAVVDTAHRTPGDRSTATPAIGGGATQTANNPPGPSSGPRPASAQTALQFNTRLIAGSSGPRSFVNTLSGGHRAISRLNENDFPPLPEQPKKPANKKSSKKPAAKKSPANMTIEQLLSSRLSLANNNNNNANSNNSVASTNKNKKSGKNGKLAKPAKIKPLKIQL